MLQWTARPTFYQVIYRRRARVRDPWETCPVTRDSRYSVVGLQPDTEYDLRVRTPWPAHLDESGKPVPSPVLPGETRSLTVTTGAMQPRRVGTLRLFPTLPLGTFPGGQSSPRLASWGKSLYVVEGHGGGIHLSRLQPTSYAVDWTRELIPPRSNPISEQHLVDATVFADRLYMLYDLRERGRPGYRPTDSRALLVTYDLQQDRLLGEPLTIKRAAARGRH